jgi:hypothetical protein
LIAAEPHQIPKIEIRAPFGVALSPFGSTLTDNPATVADGLLSSADDLLFGFVRNHRVCGMIGHRIVYQRRVQRV